jgi:hypothetical protein
VRGCKLKACAQKNTQREGKGLEARIDQRQQQQRWEALQERRAVTEWAARDIDMFLIRMLRTWALDVKSGFQLLRIDLLNDS